MITNADKIGVIDAELRLLHHSYRHLRKTSSPIRMAKLETKIAILTAIANDYRARVKEGPLFEVTR